MHPRSLKILWCCLGQRFSPRFYTKSAFLASRCEENRVVHKRSCVATRLLGKKSPPCPCLFYGHAGNGGATAPSLCSQRHHVAPPRPCAPTGPAEGGGTAAAASLNSARGRRRAEGGGRRAPAQLGATAQREAARRWLASSSSARGWRRTEGGSHQRAPAWLRGGDVRREASPTENRRRIEKNPH
jgi:hypothetical protein